MNKIKLGSKNYMQLLMILHKMWMLLLLISRIL